MSEEPAKSELLAAQSCQPCRRDSKPLNQKELPAWLEKLPDWLVTHHEGVPRLQREFPFEDFTQGVAFADQLAALADENDHHPELLISWGCVSVRWWTHSINGLHANDFIMAAKTDLLFAS
ncbi:putative pterin-4-alpha-carbinolamine dehydratase [Pseudohongiella nitratireducens]|uniref:Putative pterin-4-alpha-carbinolamine dehydratase n=2 Tax=Pseudohongiella nitratireducens TaxID=1768907 RepID=A0A916QLM3_9GAMM|nr:putative pterin-4-alpha-carbinolamine dehydratase [Pseudohongiella nitratireducens]